MKLFVMAMLVTAMALPVFAQEEMVDANQDATEQALERGLIPADLLDSSEVQQANDEALFQRRPGPPGRRPGPPGRRPGPGRPPERRPPPRQYVCEARDRQGYVYRARDFDLNHARREAVYKCERQTRSGRCRLLGCR
jgi:hypothetical protein